MAAAHPTLVLIPLCVPGHLQSMLEAGKRIAGTSRRPMSVTVLLTQMTMSANLMSDVADAIRREEAAGSGVDMSFVHLPAVELPTAERGLEAFMMRFIQLHAPCVREALAGMSSPSSSSPVAAVVVDYFCTTLFDVITRELSLPVYVYLTSGVSYLTLMLRLPALDEEIAGDFEAMEEGAVVDLPGMPPVPARLMPTPVMTKEPNFPWLVYHGKRFMEAAGIIVNTVAELEPSILAAIAGGLCVPGRRAPTVYPIGPVASVAPPSKPPAGGDGEEQAQPQPPRHECVRWLDAQPAASVVLLCFGSMGGSFSPPQLREIAAALERSGHRFLWVLRGPTPDGARYPTDADVDALLPEGFVERTRGRGLVWPTWAPQREILGSGAVGGFVTHCGWNSILESLWHGVPMVPWPLFAEQHLNAFEIVSVMGVAVAMRADRERDNFVEAAELERAVRCLMGCGGGAEEEEEGRKAREKAAAAMELCRKAVADGGSSDVTLQKLVREIGERMEYQGRTEATAATTLPPQHVHYPAAAAAATLGAGIHG